MVSEVRSLRSSSPQGNGGARGTARRRSESQQVKPRRESSARREDRDGSAGGFSTGGWHSEGVPLESIRPGDRMPGIVTNVAPFGAFVDVGAKRDAKLVEPRLGRRFQVGDRLDCVVKEVELEKRRFCVNLLDADLELAENRVPLEEMAEGDLVDGIVHHTNPYGIWVNVGAEVIGRLNVAKRYTGHLVPGHSIRDMTVQRLDLKQMKLGLTLEDPEVLLRETLTISDLLRGTKTPEMVNTAATPPREGRSQSVPPPRPAPPPAPKAEVLKPELPPEPAQPVPSTATTQALLRVGQLVDGIVVKVSSSVVMVDIGLGHLAALAVTPSIRAQLQQEDEIQGMRVERVDWDDERQKGAVVLSLEDPELKVDSWTSGRSESPPRWHDRGWNDWPSWSWSSWNRDWDWWRDHRSDRERNHHWYQDNDGWWW